MFWRILVQSRIIYKVALLCYKSYKLGSSTYLSSLLQQYAPSQSLRSLTEDRLDIPRSRTKTASRHFSSAAPRYGTIYPPPSELPSVIVHPEFSLRPISTASVPSGQIYICASASLENQAHYKYKHWRLQWTLTIYCFRILLWFR